MYTPRPSIYSDFEPSSWEIYGIFRFFQIGLMASIKLRSLLSPIYFGNTIIPLCFYKIFYMCISIYEPEKPTYEKSLCFKLFLECQLQWFLDYWASNGVILTVPGIISIRYSIVMIKIEENFSSSSWKFSHVNNDSPLGSLFQAEGCTFSSSNLSLKIIVQF